MKKLPWNAIIDEHRTTTPKIGFENKENFIKQELNLFLTGYWHIQKNAQMMRKPGKILISGFTRGHRRDDSYQVVG